MAKSLISDDNINSDETYRIWESACLFTREKLQSEKAVRFGNIGCFHFTLFEPPAGSPAIGKVKRPIFILSEKICKIHDIYVARRCVEGSIPLVSLNFCEISARTGSTREVVESCIDRVLTTLNQALHHEQIVDIVFNDIGALRVRHGKPKFRFFTSFLRQMDKTGLLIRCLKNRPGTADSTITKLTVQSEADVEKVASNRQFLNVIAEEKKNSPCAPSYRSDSSRSDKFGSQSSDTRPSAVDCLDMCQTSSNHEVTDAGVCATKTDEKMSKTLPVNQGKTDSLRLHAQQLVEKPGQKGNASERTSRSTHSCHRSCIQPILNGNSLVLPLPNLCTPKENCQSERSSLSSNSHKSYTLAKILRTDSGYSISTVSTPRSAHSRANQLRERLHAIQPPCAHTKTQTLCYLCHQRRARNIPVDLSEEIRDREHLEEQLLCVYQKLRAENETKKEQESYWNRRQDLIKQAAYNLGVADAKRIKNQFIDATQYRTFIFSSRPPTPAKELKQTVIRSELDEQTGTRQAKEKQEHENDQLLGKLEQARLMEELCKQKENQLQEKWNKQQKYKQALDFQVKHKPEPIRKLWDHDGDPVFGVHHYDPNKSERMLTRAKEIQQAQMDAAEQRNRRLQQSRIQQIEQEKAILKRVHHDLICDGLKRREAQEARRQYLENEWDKEMQDKQDRDAMDRFARLCPTKTTLMEQLDSHGRCAQCSRDLNNKGQSNVFTDPFAQGVPFVR